MTIPPDALSPMERYCHDLTALVRQGKFVPPAASEAVIARIFGVLTRRIKSNPMLLDQDGTSRWPVLAEVVCRIAVGEVPEPLRFQRVIALDYEVLIAPSFCPLPSLKSPSEEHELEPASSPQLYRLKQLFLALKQAEGRVLLFVDHFHRLLGYGEPTYAIDAWDLLKPVLARREVKMIGACTLDQYRQYIERDSAISRRFQEIVLQR